MDKIPFTVYDFFGYLASGFVILVGLAAAFAGTNDWQKTPSTIVGLLLIVVAYSVGHVIASISSYLIEGTLVRNVLGTPTTNLFRDATQSKWARVAPGYFQPLPKEERERVLAKAKVKAPQITEPTEGLFYHCFACVKDREPVLSRLNTFLNLYGFCRNMALTLLIVGVALIVGTLHGSANTGNLVSPGWWAAGCIVGAIALLYRYLKFFRLYGIEVFVSYAELP